MLLTSTTGEFKRDTTPLGIASKTIAYSFGVIGILNLSRKSPYESRYPSLFSNSKTIYSAWFHRLKVK